MDVVAVREAGLMAAEHARTGKGPYILEMKTYRYRGHSIIGPCRSTAAATRVDEDAQGTPRPDRSPAGTAWKEGRPAPDDAAH